MNYTKRLTHTLKLLLATVFAVCASLTANADTITFQDEASGLYFSTNSDGTCSVVKPTDGTTYSFDSGAVVIPTTVTYNDTEYTVTAIGKQAFYNCTSLTSVSIPESVTSIGSSAFSGCSALTTIVIPESVTMVGERAFSNCSALTSVNIPKSVTTIENWAFENCTALTKVEITNLEAWYKIYFYSFKSNPLYYAHHLYLNGEEVTDLIIPQTITTINKYAFINCLSLTSVTIPSSVTSIGMSAFASCNNLSTVTISSGLTSIDEQAFIDCIALSSINFPSTLTSIGKQAFGYCESLSSITIPNSVTSIGSSAFRYCKDLTSITISNNVKTIQEYTFYDCSSLTSVTIPISVTSIGNYAFQNCSALTFVTIPSSLKNVDYEAFKNCTGLTRVNISDLEAWCNINFKSEQSNPLYWAEHLYIDDSLLTNLVIPESITAIKNYTFEYNTVLEYLDLGDKITSIGKWSFLGCKALKGKYTNEFTPNEYKYVLLIPSSVSTIAELAFDACESLENVWIGTGCKSIATRAFKCGNLKSVTCMAYPAPILATQDVFNDDDYANAYLYISGGDENTAYSDIYNSYVDESNYWRLFLKGASTIDDDGNEGGISVGVGEVADDDIAVTTDGKTIEITGYEGEVNVYNVAGMKVYQGNDNRIELPNEGIYVVIVNGKSYKIAIK
jgi:hypothetical protein